MSAPIAAPIAAPITVASRVRPVFPDSDGEPIAENTLQFEWISTIKWNLEHQFENDPDVFVAGDNLIYTDKTDATIRYAPDVYVAFGRPKGYRGSYKVWEEGNIFPQVIFEVWSPGNEWGDMLKKMNFYEKNGAEEFYLLFPNFPIHAQGFWLEDGKLRRTRETNGFVSPRLGIRIQFFPNILNIFGPDEKRFLNPSQIIGERNAAERQVTEEARLREIEHQRAETEAARAETADARAETEAARAEAERQRAEDEAARAEAERQRADRLAARLRELGVDPDAG